MSKPSDKLVAYSSSGCRSEAVCWWFLTLLMSLWTDAKGTIREIVLPKGLDLDRPKRTRTSFTAEQLYRLELEFQRCQYVVGRERTELARQLNLSETQVRQETWLDHVLIVQYRVYRKNTRKETKVRLNAGLQKY